MNTLFTCIREVSPIKTNENRFTNSISPHYRESQIVSPINNTTPSTKDKCIIFSFKENNSNIKKKFKIFKNYFIKKKKFKVSNFIFLK